MQLSLDVWAIIFLIAAAQGFFLSLLIYAKKSKANSLLASLILLFTLCLCYYVAYWSGLDKQLPFFISITLGFNYLIGPLLYFYIRSDHNGTYVNYYHFIPFGIYILFYFSFPFLEANTQSSIRIIQVLLQNTHLLIYALVIYSWIENNRNVNNGENKVHQWRKQISWSFLGYVASFLIYYILVWTSLLRVEYDYMISFASAFFIYFVGYKGFANPQLINQYGKIKYEKSTLSAQASKAVLDKIKELLDHKKLYLDSEFKLSNLAEHLSMSTHHISQVINQSEGKSFSDFINEYRLKEAQLILADPNKKEVKLIEVAYDTGFNNKASFNNAFKKIIGMSPSQYRITQLDKMSGLS